MKKYLFIILILLCPEFCLAQVYNLDGEFTISFPRLKDWRIYTNYCDPSLDLCQFFQLKRDIKGEERKFSDITIKYEANTENIIALHDQDCFGGSFTKIDTLNLSGFKAKRWFGTNCNWLIESGDFSKIGVYSIDLIVILEKDKYLRIMSSYFASDENEFAEIQRNLISFIDEIQIKKKK